MYMVKLYHYKKGKKAKERTIYLSMYSFMRWR